MKSPEALARVLARQWQNHDLREARIVAGEGWPIRLPIGRPSPALVMHQTGEVREHLERWRHITTGTVVWKETVYRNAAEPISVPEFWEIGCLRDWAKATGIAEIESECQRLEDLIKTVDPSFVGRLVRQRSLWLGRDHEAVVRASALALELAPGIAQGRPLRSLALAGIDSKFIEQNRSLITAFLDIRFDGQASELGLSSFLNAADEGEHWLLIAPLGSGLLPFEQLHVRARELADTPLPAGRILLIENVRSLHQLPRLPGTIAILGSGLDLAWMRADWLSDRALGYWGDMDTWGMKMLALAKNHQPHVEALLMTREIFGAFSHLAVSEPVHAGSDPPNGLTGEQRAFYVDLMKRERGRLEQEFLPGDLVQDALLTWCNP